jgi:hypothetical protein
MTPEHPGGPLSAAPELPALDAGHLWAAIPAGMRLTRWSRLGPLLVPVPRQAWAGRREARIRSGWSWV